MSVSPLTLSMDSFLAALLLAAVVRPRQYAPLAALFGACDVAASLAAPLLNLPVAATLVIPVLLLLWGALMLLDCKWAACRRSRSLGVYLLPLLLSVDNLVMASANPLLDGVVSCALAAGGFALGAVLLGRVVSPARQRGWLGASFIACGLLLTT